MWNVYTETSLPAPSFATYFPYLLNMDPEYDEESKFQDYNHDEDYQYVQYTYNMNQVTYKNQQRKMVNAYNSLDKDFRIITIGTGALKAEVGVYATNDYPGTIIKNAITGAKCQPCRVGSPDEHLFFKVKLALNGMSSNSDVFYFDAPEQFERHLQTAVNQHKKEAWTNKYAEVNGRNRQT